MKSVNMEQRIRTCRCIEQMARRPEAAARLGLKDVSLFCAEKSGKNAERQPPSGGYALPVSAPYT